MARWLLPLTCAFACPLIMGGLMMGLGRDWEGAKLKREVNRINRRAGLPAEPRRLSAAGLRKLWCSACLNWKVIAALGAVAIALALISPALLARFGPGLLIAVCPLSIGAAMVVMARRSRGKPKESVASSRPAPRSTGAPVPAEIEQPVEPGPRELTPARDSH